MESHDVVVVGAGLAGLTCAVELSRAGLDVVVLEASDGVGGRVRTDLVDDMLLDRGFQLLNPAYPALRGLVDVSALDLQQFETGVVVASVGGRSVLADPVRSPRSLRGVMSMSTGSLAEKARFASYALRCAVLPPSRLRGRDDIPYGAALDAVCVQNRLRAAVLEPFLAGVLGEDEQQTSRRFVDMLLRTFVRGVPGLPAAGMQALPEQIARLLPTGCLRLEAAAATVTARAFSAGTPSAAGPSAGSPSARSAGAMTVRTASEELTGACVVVATDPVSAAALTGLPAPTMRALTTFYHRAPSSPATRRLLHLDGDRRGPVVNTAVVSDVARTYCRRGALIASTVLGADDGEAVVSAVERQLAAVYGADVHDWELVRAYPIRAALPAMLAPLNMRQPVTVADRLFVAGDHRDTASIQGAIVSGRRAATAVRRSLANHR